MPKHSPWLALSPDTLRQRTVEKPVAPEQPFGQKHERGKTGNPENRLGLRCVWHPPSSYGCFNDLSRHRSEQEWHHYSTDPKAGPLTGLQSIIVGCLAVMAGVLLLGHEVFKKIRQKRR
jgi:hypothetical protein